MVGIRAAGGIVQLVTVPVVGVSCAVILCGFPPLGLLRFVEN